MSECKCKKCKVRCQKLEELIKCSGCSGLYHSECITIRTLNKFSKLADHKKASWKCDECVNKTSSTSGARDSKNTILEAIKRFENKVDGHYEELKL